MCVQICVQKKEFIGTAEHHWDDHYWDLQKMLLPTNK